MRDYREKTVDGCIFDITKPLPMRYIPQKCDVTIRMTSDKRGQSMSLQAFNVLIEIPLETVKDIIKVAEKE